MPIVGASFTRDAYCRSEFYSRCLAMPIVGASFTRDAYTCEKIWLWYFLIHFLLKTIDYSLGFVAQTSPSQVGAVSQPHHRCQLSV